MRITAEIGETAGSELGRARVSASRRRRNIRNAGPRTEDLAVPELARLRGVDDEVHHVVHLAGDAHNLDLGLVHQAALVELVALVTLTRAHLRAETLDVVRGDAADAARAQRCNHARQTPRPNDCLHLRAHCLLARAQAHTALSAAGSGRSALCP